MTANPSDDDTILTATTALLTHTVAALEGLAHAARHLHPPRLAECVATVDGLAPDLETALSTFRALDLPPALAGFGAALDRAGNEAHGALVAFAASRQADEPVIAAYRALRGEARALEALYPLAAMLPPVSRFFLSPDRRADAALLAGLESAPQQDHTGVRHAGNATHERGGFSVYVPETLDPATPAPLAVVLHGGSGHGRLFLYNWLADARARGVALLSPTSAGRTWDFESPTTDHAAILGAIGILRRDQAIDDARILMTGMSDGGTFCWLSGLATADAPFTHIAPIAASFHPMLVDGLLTDRLARVPIHLVHGALDWMFPVAMARGAEDVLRARGADVTYSEIADLSHTYPREMNAPLLDWFLGR